MQNVFPLREIPDQPIYRVASLRRIEDCYLDQANPPLMERAGAAAANIARDLLQRQPGQVLVAAGPGNNGGDAFVLARLLQAAGHPVRCVFAADPRRLPDDARAAWQAWRDRGGETLAEFPDTLGAAPALAIDGLFGIGLSRDITAPYEDWIERLNRLTCPVLALDIPSGLEADSGRVLGCAVRASHTATFIALKPGLLTGAGREHCGRISLCNLDLLDDHGIAADGHVLGPAAYAQYLRRRPMDSHKGRNGDAVVIGGATGMVGAALLACRAALALGAGRVFAGLLAEDAPALDLYQPELMLRPPRSLIASATALAVGPGLGQDGLALTLLQEAIAREVPLLLDADALNLVATHPVLQRHLAARAAPTLLTPHPAEAARLLATTTAQVQADRIAAACELARKFRCAAVLKGSGSVVAAADGRWWINVSGNPGMSSAGMGDVLSGIALALLAQGWEALAALCAAVQLHGAAADALADAGNGPIGITAAQTIAPARRLLNAWIRNADPEERVIDPR